jgi:hypothetical protein
MGVKAVTRQQQHPHRTSIPVSREPQGAGRHDKSMNASLNYFLYILCFVLWIVAIVDCAKSSNPNKIVWIVVIILLPFLGSILYFLFGRSNNWS